jgi:hypothetical protein
VFWNVGT